MSLTLVEALRLPLSLMDRFPSVGSEDIRQALARLSGASEEDLLAVASSFTDDDRSRLDLYAKDAASLAVRHNRLDLVLSGLEALDLADLGRNWSESESMPLLFRACELMGLNAKRVFRKEAPRLHGSTREAVLWCAKHGGFPIERTRFREHRDADGFRFVVQRDDDV
jgi:hypothetical protein